MLWIIGAIKSVGDRNSATANWVDIDADLWVQFPCFHEGTEFISGIFQCRDSDLVSNNLSTSLHLVDSNANLNSDRIEDQSCSETMLDIPLLHVNVLKVLGFSCKDNLVEDTDPKRLPCFVREWCEPDVDKPSSGSFHRRPGIKLKEHPDQRWCYTLSCYMSVYLKV